MKEKPKGGPLQGVSLSRGRKDNVPSNDPRYASYSKKVAKNYGGQSRSAAAGNLRKGY